MGVRGALLAVFAVIAIASPAVASAGSPTCAGKKITIEGTDGPDRLRGTKQADVIYARAGDDTVLGKEGNDTICGGQGDDTLVGSAGIDSLFGNGGSDQISGGPGFDTTVGANGDDTLEPGGGDDVADGGLGSDTVSYAHEPAGVVVDLERHSTLKSAGRDSLPSIENATGSRFADKLFGDAGHNLLIGGLGTDVLHGRGGHDTLVQGSEPEAPTVKPRGK